MATAPARPILMVPVWNSTRCMPPFSLVISFALGAGWLLLWLDPMVVKLLPKSEGVVKLELEEL